MPSTSVDGSCIALDDLRERLLVYSAMSFSPREYAADGLGTHHDPLRVDHQHALETLPTIKEGDKLNDDPTHATRTRGHSDLDGHGHPLYPNPTTVSFDVQE